MCIWHWIQDMNLGLFGGRWGLLLFPSSCFLTFRRPHLTLCAPVSKYKISSLVSIHFLMGLIGKIQFLFGDHGLDSQYLFSWSVYWYCKEKLDIGHSWDLKGYAQAQCKLPRQKLEITCNSILPWAFIPVTTLPTPKGDHLQKVSCIFITWCHFLFSIGRYSCLHQSCSLLSTSWMTANKPLTTFFFLIPMTRVTPSTQRTNFTYKCVILWNRLVGKS